MIESMYRLGLSRSPTVQEVPNVAKRIFKPYEVYAVRFEDREFLYSIDDDGVMSTRMIPDAATFHTFAGARSAMKRAQKLVDDVCFVVNIRYYAPGRVHLTKVTI